MEHLKPINGYWPRDITDLAAMYVQLVMKSSSPTKDEQNELFQIKSKMESRCGEDHTRTHIGNAFRTWELMTGDKPPLNNLSVFNIIYGK